ncbi:hypothetical protein DFH11DRAFT_518003 [Phellopilus nigrolimitatus]|nr:hypothetical protein DFH11DRAFT_518003 [Phellopilus nigrolimitatus]
MLVELLNPYKATLLCKLFNFRHCHRKAELCASQSFLIDSHTAFQRFISRLPLRVQRTLVALKHTHSFHSFKNFPKLHFYTMFAFAVLLISLAASSMANIYVTSPVAGTTCSGGSTCSINWQDDGVTPSLANFGNAKVSVSIGGNTQQAVVQSISPSVNVATTSSIQFTVDPSIGANSNGYFIRFESLALKDSTNPSFPATGFSAKFTLNSMTGTFNSTMQALIDAGTTSAASPSSTSASASATSTKALAASSKASSSPSASLLAPRHPALRAATSLQAVLSAPSVSSQQCLALRSK